MEQAAASEKPDPNFVGDLAAAFGENAELALSGAVVLLLRRSTAFRVTFLSWLQSATGLQVDVDQEWAISGERPVGGRRGFVDIVLASPKLEIWIESKTRSALKPDQLKRFLHESYRAMHASADQMNASADPSSFYPLPNRPRIAVVVISGREQKVPAELFPWREAFPLLGCGYCWAGDTGYLRWGDLMREVGRVLPELAAVDRLIARDLITWWDDFASVTGKSQDPNAA